MTRLLGAFLRNPAVTGSVAPSSRWLAARMVEGMGLREARTVVELGPGTGAITRTIVDEIGPETLFLAVEFNPLFAKGLAEEFPRARVIHDSAEHVGEHLQTHGHKETDCILSSLPFASFSSETQHRLLTAAAAALRPGGRFATYAYIPPAWLPAGRRFRRLLDAHFSRVETSPVVWRNLPPAFVYRCRR